MMMRVSSAHPIRSLRGEIGLVVERGECRSTVLFQFGAAHNQMFAHVENYHLTPCRGVPTLTPWRAPGSHSAPVAPALPAIDPNAVRGRNRNVIPCAGDDDETWVLSLDTGAMNRQLRCKLELSDYPITHILLQIEAEKTRLELRRFERLRELRARGVTLHRADTLRLTKLKKKYDCQSTNHPPHRRVARNASAGEHC